MAPEISSRLKAVLDLVTSMFVLTAAVVLVWSRLGDQRSASNGRSIPVPPAPISIEYSPAMGSEKAPVVMIEFTDFECPYCGRFVRETLPSLQREYLDRGLVQLVVKHLPLSIHPQAASAAATAECAWRRGRFWELHDELFGEGVKRDPESLRVVVGRLGLADPAFDMCTRADGREAVLSDSKVAASLGIRATPGFLLGRRLADGRVAVNATLNGAVPVEDFRSALDAELSHGRWIMMAAVTILAGSVFTLALYFVVKRMRARSRALEAGEGRSDAAAATSRVQST